MNADSTNAGDGTLESIFSSALAYPPTERSVYLAGVCGDNAQMRERLEALLRAHEAAEEFLPRSPRAGQEFGRAVTAVANAGGIPADKGTDLLETGTTIGQYKLREKIGEGGCGVVYVAEQEEPVRRRVALKVIKLGMDTKSVIARFEAERQALALMDHPNIAKVFEAGATETGRPYFVMELVHGLKITEYCDEAKLSIRSRLELFCQVCHAIQHAHQKGIIHRDIKPSNILVTVNDGVPVPKVIDFGIAKATGGQQLTDKTIYTALEQFIGTPAYMSPEQAVLTSVDIDTRSDIYALGVLLYELLTGNTPFDASELLAAGLDEMRRTIIEKEPDRPSTRLSTLAAQELGTRAQRRSLGAPKLVSELRGDLDWIVMKCLEKDRARRYETANGLARDITRHLSDEPVIARPPSRAYKLTRMVRRNKLTFGAMAAVFATLLLGLAVSLWEAVRATRAEASAKDQRASAIAEKNRADAGVAAALSINDFLLRDLLVQADVDWQLNSGFTPNPNLTVREAVDRAAERVGERFKHRPLIEAEVRETIGGTYINLMQPAKAEAQLKRAVALRKVILGDDEITLKYKRSLAIATEALGHFEEAEVLLRQVVEQCKKSFGTEDARTLEVSGLLANVLDLQHQRTEAAQLLENVLNVQQKKLGPEAPATLFTMGELGEVYADQGLLSKAITLHETVLKTETKTQGPRHPSLIATKAKLARDYSKAGKSEAAAPLWQECLSRAIPVFGAHSATVASIFYWLREAAGSMDLSTRQKCLDSIVLPPDPDPRLVYLHACVLAISERWPEARAQFERAIKLNPDDNEAWHGLSAVLIQLGDLNAYRENCRKSVQQFAGSNDLAALHRIAKDCLALPSPGVDLKIVGDMADRSLATGTNGSAHVLAMAEYRRGRYQSAAEWAERVQDCPPEGDDTRFECAAWAQVLTSAVLAMARHQLGQEDAATTALGKARYIAETKMRNDGLDSVFAGALLREAETLIQGPRQTQSQSK